MAAQAFIDAIVEDPDDVARWSVYADWLLERGDARGELIQLGLAGIAAPELDVYRLSSAWLGVHAACWELAWRRGFLHAARMTARIDLADREPIDALFADPHAALLAELDTHPLSSAWRPALFAASRRRLRVLRTGRIGPFGAHLDELLPDLAELELNAHDPELDTFAARSLRCLTADPWSCRAAVAGTFHAPALRRLTWHLEHDDPLLHGDGSFLHDPPPHLVELDLRGKDPLSHGDDLERLCELPVARQLVRLDVDWGSLDVLERLIAAHARLPALRHLAMWIYAVDAMSDHDIRALRARAEAAFPGVELAIPWETLREGIA